MVSSLVVATLGLGLAHQEFTLGWVESHSLHPLLPTQSPAELENKAETFSG